MIYDAAVLGDDPVAYWRLGERRGTTTAADASGSNRGGSYKRGVTLGVPGVLGGNTAASFDGSKGKVVVNDHAELRLNGAFSIEFWAQGEPTGKAWPGIMNKSGSWTANGYLIWYSTDGRIHFKRNNTEWVTPAGALSADRLRHFVVTYDGSSVTWYVDGARASSGPASLPLNLGTTALELGSGDAGNPGKVVLDEVALYPSALSGTQVAAHHLAADRK